MLTTVSSTQQLSLVSKSTPNGFDYLWHRPNGAFFYPLIVWDAKSSIPEGTIQLTDIRKNTLLTRMPLFCSPFDFTPNLIKITSFAVKLLITLKKSCFIELKYMKKSDFYTKNYRKSHIK